MSSCGLAIWDENGVLVMDSSTRLPRSINVIYIDGSDGAQDAAGAATGEPFFSFYREFSIGTQNNNGNLIIVPTFSVSGTTISWVYRPATSLSGAVLALQHATGWLNFGVF